LFFIDRTIKKPAAGLLGSKFFLVKQRISIGSLKNENVSKNSHIFQIPAKGSMVYLTEPAACLESKEQLLYEIEKKGIRASCGHLYVRYNLRYILRQ